MKKIGLTVLLSSYFKKQLGPKIWTEASALLKNMFTHLACRILRNLLFNFVKFRKRFECI